MLQTEIINLIQALGFQPGASKDIYVKEYKEHDCSISLDFQKKKILYPSKIQIGDETTANFSHPENIVVLECVDRLLQKGYHPFDLFLEKKWSLGRSQKSGKADITIKGQDGNTILIIECKTHGQEFEKEKNRMQSNGGQLFSYLQQDRNAKFLCLYASTLLNGDIKYENAIVRIEDDEKLKEEFEKGNEDIRLYEKAKTVVELHQAWKENYSCYFHPNGIFEKDVQPYQIDLKPLKVKDLKQLKEGDGSFIHNQFAEILRHNNISDKENAFNKMISLFLCKVVDESKESNEVVDFQWKEGIDNYEDLQDRLQKLYQIGMREYLKEEIIYFESDYVEKAFRYHKKAVAKDKMTAMLKALKFYTNNEFAFKEVHNEKLFKQNAKVVNEVVQLLQPYRIRYSQKQQFLGNLFELLLNDGLKQSEGQFFTPVPITRFIVSSLPIQEWVQERWQKGEVHLLPKVLDYACGSGHFLTEAIDEIQGVIENLGMSQHRDDTRWARDYIFGIEKDYRLARISKIACFLNGAGDANIVYGDGLENHEDITPGGFDILIANPPYSIKDFKQHLHLKRNSFELVQYLKDTASEIETLFVERIHQLLKPGGMAGIILPSSILSNSGIYTRAREVILRNFHIKAIVELGGQTFIATGTNTVILFLQKHINGDSQHFSYRADAIYEEQQFDDAEYHDSHLLRDYCSQIGVGYDAYISLISRTPKEALRKGEFFAAYQKWFGSLTEINNLKNQAAFQKRDKKEQELELNRLFFDKVLAKEKEKFYYFCLAYGQQVVIVKAGDKEKEKVFLGYEWSKRRGFEGMRVIGPGKLYDADDFNNPERCNSYIRWAFVGESFSGLNRMDESSSLSFPQAKRVGNLSDSPLTKGAEGVVGKDSGQAGMTASKTMPSVHPSVAEHVSAARLTDMMDFSRIEFDKQITLSPKKNEPIKSKWDVVKIGSIATLEYGKGLPAGKRVKGKYPVVGSNGIDGYHNDYLIEGPAVIIGRKGSAGKINLVIENCYPIDTTFYLKPKDSNIFDLKFAFYLLKQIDIEKLSAGTGVPGLNRNLVYDIAIPLPPLDIQKKIIAEIEAVEKEAEKSWQAIHQLNGDIDITIKNIGERRYQQQALGSYFDINQAACNPHAKFGERYFTYVDIESVENGTGAISFDKKIRGVDAPSRARRLAADGSILLSTVRPYLRGFAYIEEVPEDCVFSTGFAVIKAADESQYITKLLFFLFMYSSALMEQMQAKMPKAGYPSISVDDISAFLIPDIPLKQQIKIVAELGDKEQRIAVLKAQIAKADEKKDAILDKYLR